MIPVEARRVLILGGARSGKSAEAERLAGEWPGLVVAIATARTGLDPEMDTRIERHRRERPARFRLLEAPDDLPGALAAEARAGRLILVDCLTLWLTNRMLAGADLEAESAALVAALDGAAGRVALVANEVGDGIVPVSELGRAFRDAQGRLNQRVARACDTVVRMVAGLPILLKPQPTPFSLRIAPDQGA